MLKFLKDIKNKTELVDLALFAAIDIGIPEEELLEMEFKQWKWIYEVWEKKVLREQANFANLMSLLANINRAKDTKPFLPKDFMPRKQKTEEEEYQDILAAFGVREK